MMAGTLLAPRNSSSRGLLKAKPVTFAQKSGSGLSLPPVQQDGMLPGKFHIDSKIFDVATTDPPGELSQPISIGDKIDCGPVDCLAECVHRFEQRQEDGRWASEAILVDELYTPVGCHLDRERTASPFWRRAY